MFALEVKVDWNWDETGRAWGAYRASLQLQSDFI